MAIAMAALTEKVGSQSQPTTEKRYFQNATFDNTSHPLVKQKMVVVFLLNPKK